MKPDTRIIFMGTPDFSVPALQKLAQQPKFDICLVVTQPDRPKGRGKKMAYPPVKAAALSLGLDVYQPETLKTDEAVQKLESLNPDFLVVAAFGQILSQKVLDIPKFYPINIHASLLPKYRGASPIQAAIKNMDAETGITTMVMASKMDAGDILLTLPTPINEKDTAQTLHDRLGQMGGQLIIRTIDEILAGGLEPRPQDHSKATYVKLLKKADGHIDWNLSGREIQAHINAMTPWPGAFTSLDNRTIKIFKGQSGRQDSDTAPGTIYRMDKSGIYISCGRGTLVILELMGTSGKRLSAEQYLCGNTIEPFSQFDR